MQQQRKSMLREIVEKHDLGALIFWRPDELVLTLGYLPLWGLSFLIYTKDDDLILFVPELEPEDILPTNITIKKYPWGIISCPDPWKILYDGMKEVLSQKKISRHPVSFIRNIGGTAPCRMSAEQPPLPADLIDHLASLTEGGCKDVTPDLLQLYAYKTVEDVRGIKLTHQVAAIAVRVFYENAKPGVTEAAVAAAIEYSVQVTIGQTGIYFAKAWPMIQSGPNTSLGGRYNRTTGRLLQPGELVLLEMGICVNGYWADISRVAQTSKVSQQQKQLFEIVYTAQQKAIALMKPGVAMAAIDTAARSHIESGGYGPFFNHALGHHVGFRYHDFGPTLSPASTGILEEGMVLTVEPGVYSEAMGGGVRIEDNILITRHGHEMLSDYPRLLSI